MQQRRGFSYNFNETIAANIGYRYLSIYHEVGYPSIYREGGNFQFDVDQQRPLVGVGIRF